MTTFFGRVRNGSELAIQPHQLHRGVQVGPKQTLLVVLATAMIVLSSGCGGSKSTGSSSSQQPPISISFQPSPVTAISLNATAQLTAVVLNDANNYGVDWCVATDGKPCGASSTQCPIDACGHFGSSGTTDTHSQSGQPVVYYPPTSVAGKQIVQILAFATADHTKNVTAPISVVGFSGSLSGRYIFQLKGTNPNPMSPAQTPQAYQIAGAINFDGNGGVALEAVNGQTVGGEETYAAPSGSGSAYIVGGSYSLGSDGRGTLTITTNNPALGTQGVQSFSLVTLSASQTLIAQVDGTASASGTMDLQTSTAALSGGYAFVSSGADASGNPTAFGGVINIDLTNGISGKGSVADADYLGSVQNCAAPSGLVGTVGAPDHFGAVQFQLNTCFATNPLQLTGYIVDSSNVKLVESDLSSSAQTGFATSGVALGQGAATGTFTGSPFSGTYVFGILGIDISGLPVSLTSTGLLTPTGAAAFSGTDDEYGTVMGISDGFTGNYTVDPTGTGRVDAPLIFNTAANSAASTPELIFYLTGNGAPAVVLNADVTAGTVGSGIAYPQSTTTPAFSGEYGFYATNLNSGSEIDSTGQMTATTNTITGFMDGSGGYNGSPGSTSAQLSGSFQALPANGAFSGQLSADSGYSSLIIPRQVDYYLIDGSHGFFIETDSAAELLGYFATRTPVCAGCP